MKVNVNLTGKINQMKEKEIKPNFSNLARRGLKNAEMEFELVCLGYNFSMYHSFWLRNKLHVKQREQLSS